jgi:hypothetical protein
MHVASVHVWRWYKPILSKVHVCMVGMADTFPTDPVLVSCRDAISSVRRTRMDASHEKEPVTRSRFDHDFVVGYLRT